MRDFPQKNTYNLDILMPQRHDAPVPQTLRERILDKGKQAWLDTPAGTIDIEVIALAAAREMAILIRERIQAECGMCDGHGYTIETGTDSGHACDGTEESCL